MGIFKSPILPFYHKLNRTAWKGNFLTPCRDESSRPYIYFYDFLSKMRGYFQCFWTLKVVFYCYMWLKNPDEASGKAILEASQITLMFRLHEVSPRLRASISTLLTFFRSPFGPNNIIRMLFEALLRDHEHAKVVLISTVDSYNLTKWSWQTNAMIDGAKMHLLLPWVTNSQIKAFTWVFQMRYSTKRIVAERENIFWGFRQAYVWLDFVLGKEIWQWSYQRYDITLDLA